MKRIDRATRRYQKEEVRRPAKIDENKKTRAENKSVMQIKLKKILK